MHRTDMFSSVIDLAILGLLNEQELHGYELRKRISELGGLRAAISFGSLYPALTRLERVGAVKAVEAATDVRPAMPLTGSLAGEASAFLARRAASTMGGRGKKVYGISTLGREMLLDLLDDPATDDKAFGLKVAFCHELPPDRRLGLFERRRAQLANLLVRQQAGERSNRRRTGGDRVDSYLRSLREHDSETIQHDIAWLDRLIAAERATVQEDQS